MFLCMITPSIWGNGDEDFHDTWPGLIVSGVSATDMLWSSIIGNVRPLRSGLGMVFPGMEISCVGLKLLLCIKSSLLRSSVGFLSFPKLGTSGAGHRLSTKSYSMCCSLVGWSIVWWVELWWTYFLSCDVVRKWSVCVLWMSWLDLFLYFWPFLCIR